MNKIKKKKILFDIIHLAHLNFFKNAINEFHKRGYDVEITYLDRGKIAKVLKKELPQYKHTKIGTYSKTTLGKISMILERMFRFFFYLMKSRPHITAGVGDFILAFSSKLFGIPSVMYYDDFEFKVNFNLSDFFGTRLYVPYCLPKTSKKIIRYKSFKELAYLHPDIYKPQKSIITKMSLKENEYVFIREVAGISMNYTQLEKESLLGPIKYLHNKGIKMILSLEDKSRRKFYEPYCTILEEPLEDLYSIVHYALFTICSGDSMARESALLGVPSIYTGGRTMYVNNPFLEWKGVYKLERQEDIINTANKLLNKKIKQTWSKKITKIIKKNLADTTQVILDSLNKNLGV